MTDKKYKCPGCGKMATFKGNLSGRFRCSECGGSFDSEDVFSMEAPAFEKVKYPSFEDGKMNKALNEEKDAIKGNDADSKPVSFDEEEKVPAFDSLEEARALTDVGEEEAKEEEEVVIPVEVEEEEKVEEVEEVEEEEDEEEEMDVDFPFGPSKEIKDRTALFYEIYTTYEDADPYLDDDILVVCDGCGGAGSSKHTLTKEKMGSYEAIKELVLPEDKNDCLKPQLEILYKPILDSFKSSDKQARTSAFIGSRLVLPRYIYAFKKYKNLDIPFDEKLEKIKNFIEKGMRKEVKELGLEADIVGRKALLSTTFVSVIFNGNPDEDEELDIDVIWAGDSRAYVLYPEGLKKLVVDDEDEAGALTNLFCIKEGREIKVNHRHYKLKKPCIVFTCSDGIFDAFPDSLTLECLLTQFMQERDSLEEYALHLKNDAYSYVKSDDCTLALRTFGFKDYNEMKNAYLPRFKYDEEMMKNKMAYKPYVEMKEDPTVINECVNMLVQRLEIGTILSQTAEVIAEELKKGNFSDPYTSLLKPLYEKYLEDVKEKEEELEEAKIESIGELEKYILEDDNFLNLQLNTIFNIASLKEDDNHLLDEAIDLIEKYNEYNNLKEKCEKDLNKVKNEYFEQYWKFIVIRFNRIKGTLKLDDVLVSEEAKAAFINEQIENGLSEDAYQSFKVFAKDEGAVANKVKTLIENIKENKEKLAQLEEKEYDKIEIEQIREILEKFFKEDKEVLFDAIYVNNPDIALSIASYKKVDVSILSEGALALLIYQKYDRPDGPKELVNIRLNSEQETTIIDDQFNPTFLKRALDYSKCGKPNEEVEAFLEKYMALEEDIDTVPEED